jgi:serine/threonine protein kinase
MNIHLSPASKFEEKEILELIAGFHKSGKKVGKGDRNTIKNFQLGDQLVTIKAFKVPNLINKIVYRFFRKSKAVRSFDNATFLLNNGIGTPKPIAYLEEIKLLTFGKSYYVSDFIDADLTYRELIREPDYPDRENILRQFTRFTYDLHESGILFKDHSPGNTLIVKRGDAYDFYLVDLNRMDFKTLNFEERIRNFTRLTSKEDMVAIMSDEYAKLAPWSYDEIYGLMWSRTQIFQKKFYRKKHIKDTYLFWRN